MPSCSERGTDSVVLNQLLVLLLAASMAFAGCGKGSFTPEHYAVMLGKMFPGRTFRFTEGKYVNDLGESYLFQGWTAWDGGLWKVAGDGRWVKTWPGDDAFWAEKSAQITDDGLRIYQRKPVPDRGSTVAEYTWEYAFTLRWNPETGTFDRVP